MPDRNTLLGLLRTLPVPGSQAAATTTDPVRCVSLDLSFLCTLNPSGPCRPLATMPQATALGTLVLLLLLPLPRGAGVLGDNSDIALDYWALEGEEGTEQPHYHDPCKAGRYHHCSCLRASRAEVLPLKCK